MSEPTAQTPAAAAPAEPAKPSLEDSLASLDDTTRQFVIGEVRGARSEAKNLRERLAAVEPKATEYDRLAEASKTELDRKAEEATRWQTETERWRGVAVGARIEALAADFADPSDAITALASKSYLDAGGQIDEAAIKADLEEVLTKKPHWRKSADTPAVRVPAPNPAQGKSGNPAAGAPRDQFAALFPPLMQRG